MQTAPTLHDEFSYTGVWWLPDHKETKWPGTLSFKPENGARLDLLVDSDSEQGPLRKYELQRMVGVVLTDNKGFSIGNTFALLNCTYNGIETQPGITNYRFLVSYVLRGFIIFSQTEEIIFKSASAAFSSLGGWMPPDTSIAYEFEQDDSDSEQNPSRTATYQKPAPIEIQLSTIQARLSFTSWLQSKMSSREIHWRQSHSVRIEPDRIRSLQWYIRQIYRIRDLLSFLTGLPVEPRTLDATVSASQIDNTETDQGIRVYHSVRLPKSDEEFYYRMPFPLHRLDNQVQTVFNSWLELNDDQLVPYNLCLDVINNANQFWQFEFLALVQALESFHRNKFEEKGRRQGKYRNEKGTIKKRGADLIDRLRELLDLFPEELSQGPRLDDDFLKRIVITRNYYTHYTSRYRKHAFKGYDLYRTNTRIIPFIAYFLYRGLGISDDVVREGFEATNHRGLWKPRLAEQLTD